MPTNSSGFKVGELMTVRNLYTFGAPKMAGPALTDPRVADGCFPGLRLVNKDTPKTGVGAHWVDIVPPLLKMSVYKHTKQEVGFLYNGDRLDKKTCGWSGNTLETPSISLHSTELYVERVAAKYPHLSTMATVALASSYDDNDTRVAQFVRERGYGLVASAICRRLDEVSHLIQNPRTLDCWLTFEGSDNANDWLNNMKLFRTDFCGLKQRVHTGFRNCTMAMVDEPSFQASVRPKLGHCKSVTVLGHSLGGAIAGLFTACAHNQVKPGEPGYEEWQKIWFEKKETKLMDFL